MSDLMYYEAKLPDGSDYELGDWKKYAVHDDKNIKGFFGKYRYLSNFYDAEVWFEGLKYRSSECAYQSAKVIAELREPFTTMTDANAKKAWKLVPKKGLVYPKREWDKRKRRIMMEIVFNKFVRNPELRFKLITECRGKYLEELNHWGDRVWGVDVKTNSGENWLGLILMDVRDALKRL
jgi:ribA/ribD-fused uncharacterized protein